MAERMGDERLTDRFLVVIYDLADGRTDISVDIETARLKANRIGIATMTDAEFHAYLRSVGERVKKLRAEAGRLSS